MADLTPYGFSGQGIVAPDRFPQMQNPYGVQSPQQPQEQAPQPGLFDSHPFHDYLMQNAKKDLGKNPWELTDEDINKGFENYMGENGPIGTIIGHDEAMHNRRGSGTSIDDHVKKVLAYHKLMGQNELQQQLPQLKAYLQSQKPAGAPQPTPDDKDTLANSMRRAGLNIESGLAIPAGNVLSALSPLAGTSGVASTAAQFALPFLGAFNSPEEAQGTAERMFKAADEAKTEADKVPHSETLGGKFTEGITDFVASLPTAGAQYLGVAYQDGLKQGKSQFNAWVDALKQAGTILAGVGVGHVASGITNPLARRATGAIGGAAIPATTQVLSGENIDPVSAAIGAAAGGLTASAREKVNAKSGETKTATGAEPTKAPVQEGKPTDTSSKAGVAPTELSEQSQGILSDALDNIYKSKDPAQARALHDQLLASVPEDERPAFTDAFANDWAEAHGTKPEDLGFGTGEEPPQPTEKEKALNALDKFQKQGKGAAILADSPAGREFDRLLKNARDAGATEDEINAVGKEPDPLVNRTQGQLKLVNEYFGADPIRKGVITRKLSKELGVPVSDVKGLIEHIGKTRPKAPSR